MSKPSSPRPSTKAMSSSWTIWPPTRARPPRRPSRPGVHGSYSCHPIALTSIQSKWPSQSLKPISAQKPSGPSMPLAGDRPHLRSLRAYRMPKLLHRRWIWIQLSVRRSRESISCVTNWALWAFVGVVTSWALPGVFVGVTTDDLPKVQAAIDGGPWAKNAGADDWAGYAIAKVLEIDLDDVDRLDHPLKLMCKSRREYVRNFRLERSRRRFIPH